MNICVFAAAGEKADRRYFALAEALGAAMARRGHRMIFGGGATGLMGSAARSLLKDGGRCTGIAPRFFDEPGILLPGCTEFIFTDTMSERKALMEELAEGFLALPGGIGTYEELLEVLTLRQLGRHEKPIALLDTLDYFGPLEALLRHTVQAGFLGGDCLSLYRRFDRPEPALDYLSGL